VRFPLRFRSIILAGKLPSDLFFVLALSADCNNMLFGC
jgi:hypothetical protein